MHDKVYSCALDGLNPGIIEVETDIQRGLPSFSIVGLGDASVQESKERVRSAIKNSNVQFPPLRKTVNLAPANIRKYGPIFDLPIAVSILAASNQIPKQELRESLFVGELSLDGTLREVRGILPITAHAARCGISKIYLPKGNADEASLVKGIEILPVSSLTELIKHCSNITIRPHKRVDGLDIETSESIYDFKFVQGMEEEKRILEIAATGKHHILMNGPPGSGKTLMARTFPTILPDLTQEEIMEVTSIYSVAGLLPVKTPLVTKPVFREVHSLATSKAIFGGGGGSKVQPGEITLGHKGVLFFDELAEFSTKVLEILRKPLEDREVLVQRTATKIAFPADFIFIGALNPCPCGFYGDPHKACVCSMSQITKYKKKLSGPFLDRIDIFISMRRMKFEKFTNNRRVETSEIIKARVVKARSVQIKRQGKSNSELRSQEVKRYCAIDKECRRFLGEAIAKFRISTRGVIKILKVGRTIADLEGKATMEIVHVAEAFRYRDYGL